ncbi:uncharacterized protein A1O9_09186 [Exophiala aquamarina CBS 119918]|uniref:Uncharacterized protein n=1 Tax=Exophiala aquamarina CBS 119918 TaxID=1182545 RepID=A0A072P3Q3_9EURO|nr:uncharacterized protein A1O9_09186 [Exophiala aquamarina CBS 119918]KEF54744.1 hypothetical protein A1O9_09186 [Exophiala aquamarina CBS 119918]
MPAPAHYLLAIFPGYQLLDLAGPLDILNILSLVKADLPLTLTIIAESLEPVPSKPIPPSSANWTFDLQAQFPETNGKVNTNFNQYLLPDVTFDQYISSLDDPSTNKKDGHFSPVDVLLIPGGLGTRLNRVSSDGQTVSNIRALLDFIPKVAPHIAHAIITVCTGSDALAQTGLLDNRRATTNISRFQDVEGRNPNVKWQSWARWVRSIPESTDRANIEMWTSAGISAGMDVTLAFIAHHYGGLELSRDLAKRLEYDWREIPEGKKDPLYEKHWAA